MELSGVGLPTILGLLPMDKAFGLNERRLESYPGYVVTFVSGAGFSFSNARGSTIVRKYGGGTGRFVLLLGEDKVFGRVSKSVPCSIFCSGLSIGMAKVIVRLGLRRVVNAIVYGGDIGRVMCNDEGWDQAPGSGE